VSTRSSHRTYRAVMTYRPENLDKAVREFTEVLGIDDMEGPYVLEHLGVRVYISWNAGLEFVSPHGDAEGAAATWEMLKTRGEGLSNVAFGVDDLDAAEKRATDNDHPRMGPRIDARTLVDDWSIRFAFATESVLTPIAGVPVTLIESREAPSKK